MTVFNPLTIQRTIKTTSKSKTHSANQPKKTNKGEQEQTSSDVRGENHVGGLCTNLLLLQQLRKTAFQRSKFVGECIKNAHDDVERSGRRGR